MNITAKIIADSVNPRDSRITSWILKYPRFIHSELMTHRAFSRNAASSRAIPFKKMLDNIRRDPATFERWGAEQKGMQSGEQIDFSGQAKIKWDEMAFDACMEAENLADLGLHKSICNRALEPYAHMTTLVTATDMRNFFGLRAHPDAMPEFQVLAYRMLDLYLKSEPTPLKWGEWHLPFGDMMYQDATVAQKLMVVTARAARISYDNFEGPSTLEKDIFRHDALRDSGHWSPFEHPAQACVDAYPRSNFDVGGSSGWYQYRKMFPTELRKSRLTEVMASKPDWITL